jgi:hypothetical protein
MCSIQCFFAILLTTHISGVKSDSFIHSYQNHILLLLFCSVLGIFTCDRKKHLLLSAFFFDWYLSITFISHASHSQPHKWHKWHGINVNAEFTHHPRIKSEDIISIISSCRVLDDIFLVRFLTNASRTTCASAVIKISLSFWVPMGHAVFNSSMMEQYFQLKKSSSIK